MLPAPPPTETKKFGPRHINVGPLDGALAYGQSQREIMRVAEIVRTMLNDTWQALRTGNMKLADDVSERDDQVDLLDHEIKHFVTSLGGSELDADDAAEQMHQLRYLNQLETTGDIIDKNITELVRKKIRKNVRFSVEGSGDIDSLFEKVIENLLIAETAFATRDRMLAQQLIRHKDQINQLEHELRDRHFARLQSGLTESHETSAIHLDLLTHLKHINSCVTHVAYGIVGDRTDDSS
jgi:phosphate:Na+ symporter